MRETLSELSVVVLGLLLAALVGAGSAHAEILTVPELQAEMHVNEALRLQVRHSGYPDLAQRWRVHSELPWDTRLIRRLYLDARR